MKEFLHIVARHRCDAHLAKKRLDVPVDPPAIDSESACLLGLFAARADLPG
jgi:hypothetical protein